jgi:predicted nucleic acid-binding Zn ribbon protein
VDNDDDPVHTALATARGMVRGTARRRRRPPPRPTDAAPTGGYSGPAPDDTDPQRIGAVAAGFFDDRGWQRPLAEARLFTHWADIVGSEVAAHCAPAALTAGELRISAVSTAWATQLRLLAGTLLARVVAEAGPTTVTRIVVTGPVGPSWKHGRFAVRGARGPRDTYG